VHVFVSFRKRYITGSFLALPRAVVSLWPAADAWDDALNVGGRDDWHPPQVASSCSMCKN